MRECVGLGGISGRAKAKNIRHVETLTKVFCYIASSFCVIEPNFFEPLTTRVQQEELPLWLHRISTFGYSCNLAFKYMSFTYHY